MQLLTPLHKPKTPFFLNPKPRVVVVAAEVGVGIGVLEWVLHYNVIYHMVAIWVVWQWWQNGFGSVVLGWFVMVGLIWVCGVGLSIDLGL